MLLGQELKFKNKLCNFKRVPFSVTFQGIALGNNDSKRVALKGQKLSNTEKIFKAFALSGRIADCYHTQGDALG